MIGSQDLADAAAALVERAKKAGADACDVLAIDSSALSVEVLDARPSAIERAESTDLGLRVLVGQSQAIVSGSSLRGPDLDALAERAVAMARAAPPDPLAGLAPRDRLAGIVAAPDLADDASPDAATLERLAREAEAAGRAVDGITRTGSAAASASRRRVALVTSHGFSGAYERTGYGISAAMIAGEGTAMERAYDYTAVTHFADLGSAADIGAEAGRRAIAQLNPRKLASRRCPVIFDNRMASSLVSHVAAAANGASIARGTSFLKTRMAEQILPAGVSIIDDPLRPRGLASRPFDAEGLAPARLELVEDGRLMAWLLDCRSARKLGLESNARASRSVSGPPSPSSTNLYMAPGALSLAQLLRETGSGLLVTSMFSTGVNLVTGDYSRGCSGFWIENGEPSCPVSEITIAGNLNDMLAGLTPASDLEFRSSVNAPSCRIAEMTLAGA